VPTPRLARLGDLLGDWETDATAAHTARVTGQPRGPVTGLEPLDRALGECLAPGVHILHGNTGSGKTALGLQLAAHCGCPCVFITTEMSALELFRRHTARVTSQYLGRFKTGEMDPATSLGYARQAAEAAPALALADATLTFADPTWLREAARAVQGDAPHLLLVLDSLHTWADGAPGEATEYDRLNAALATLRQLASGLGCAVLVTAERNRAAITKGGLNAGAGSRKLEYSAESVLDLERDPDARTDAQGEVEVNLIVRKNRNGAAGHKIPLRFHGALQRFRAC
jgi:replicative DNA helicase